MASSNRRYLPRGVEQHFPFLTRDVYEVKSEPDVAYNCIAFAAGDDRWWEPDPGGVYYWPPQAKREYTVEAYVQAFEAIGYEKCENALYERGFEKVALYFTLIGNPDTPPGSPTHAALQIGNGSWVSKLGTWHDIQHSNLDCLNGEDCTGTTRPYGQPVQFLKRAIRKNRKHS